MDAPRSARLTFLSGPRDGETAEVPAAEGEVVIGRGKDCTVVLAHDPDVSREHARLTWSGEGWSLEDLDSRNGTFVGEFAHGRRLDAPAPLAPGAVFRVGSTRLRIEGPATDPDPRRARLAARPDYSGRA